MVHGGGRHLPLQDALPVGSEARLDHFEDDSLQLRGGVDLPGRCVSSQSSKDGLFVEKDLPAKRLVILPSSFLAPAGRTGV